MVAKEPNSTENSNAENKEEEWLTPIEFENYCGKSNCRDWKKTIKVGGQPLLSLLESKILVCHAVSCSCGICNENEHVIGPIIPFIRHRRRKKDETQMVKAYKKFLNLKPPTLLFSNQHQSLLANLNSNSNNSSSINLSNSLDQLLAGNNNCNNTNNNINVSNLKYSSSHKSNETADENEASEKIESENESSNFSDSEYESIERELVARLKKFRKSQLDIWHSLEQKVRVFFCF
jgi:hypothetical protein